MPLDPSIYNQPRVNLGAGLSSLLDEQRKRELDRINQANAQAAMAQQQQLGALQFGNAQRQQEAFDVTAQQDAQKRAQIEQILPTLTPQQQQWIRMGVPVEKVLVPEKVADKTPWYVQRDEQGKIVGIHPIYQQLEQLKAKNGEGGQSFAPIQGSDSYWTFDRRTGTYSKPDNAPLAPSANPDLKKRMSAATEGGKTGIDIYTKQYHLADSSAKVIDKTQKLLDHLKTGDITTGMGADLRVGLSRAQALLGGKSGAKNATDSQIADVMMGSEVFPLISSLGIGARGMDTPAEREFMRKVLTGELSLEKGTLIKMAEMRMEAAQKDIDRWNTNVDQGNLDNYFQSVGIPKTKFGKQSAARSYPDGAVQMLKSNPNLRAQFDAKYGQGASASVLGQ